MRKINNLDSKVVRIYNENNMAEGDLIMLHDEDIDTTQPLTILILHILGKKQLSNYTIKELQNHYL